MRANALRPAELVLPGRVVVSSASECRWNVSSSGVRFGRCGYRVGGLETNSCRLAGGWADNGEPTSRSPVPGRGHLFQQGSPPSPPWCVRPGAFFFALPPSSRPSLIPFQPTAPQDTKKATPFEAACCQGCGCHHRRGVAAGNLGCAECLVIQVGFGHGRVGGVVVGKLPSRSGKGHDSAEELSKDLWDLGSEEEEA